METLAAVQTEEVVNSWFRKLERSQTSLCIFQYNASSEIHIEHTSTVKKMKLIRERLYAEAQNH